MDSHARISRNPRVTYRDLEDGGVLLHLDTGAYHGLNSTGSEIWKLLEQEPTLPQLIDGLRGQLSNAPVTLETETTDFVRMMQERGLISVDAGA